MTAAPIRRQITPVVHCDFLSMYPTVCTLLGLWNFVRANGVTQHDNTDAVTALLARSRDELAEQLRAKDGWKDLASLVQVRPRNDLFPVRARYPGADTLNIGLNYLSADEPQWFTLADVLASQILTGRTPEVIRAIRFRPKGLQKGLKPIDIAGQTIDPAADDSRSEALTALALREALAAAKAIGEDDTRSLVLSALAPHLAPEQRDEALREALAAAKLALFRLERSPSPERSRALRALGVLPPRLAPEQRDELLREPSPPISRRSNAMTRCTRRSLPPRRSAARISAHRHWPRWLPISRRSS
jgi:hypothetical protein